MSRGHSVGESPWWLKDRHTIQAELKWSFIEINRVRERKGRGRGEREREIQTKRGRGRRIKDQSASSEEHQENSGNGRNLCLKGRDLLHLHTDYILM